jgi:hypothetical protein
VERRKNILAIATRIIGSDRFLLRVSLACLPPPSLGLVARQACQISINRLLMGCRVIPVDTPILDQVKGCNESYGYSKRDNECPE